VLRVADILKHNGVFLFFVSQKLDSRDPNFRQLLIMYGMQDEQYLVGLADKVHRGQEGRVLNGFRPGGKCYGYRNVPIEDPSRKGRYGRPAVIGVRQEIIEEEAAVIRRIFDLYPSGWSLAGIAKKLNAEGVLSPQRPKTGSRSPRAWCPSGIREILRNETYRGVNIWNRTQKVRNPETGRKETRQRPDSEWVRVERPELRIVSEEQWMRVQLQIELVSGKWGPKRLGGFNRTEQSRTYIFSGLLKCGVCGAGMTITSSTMNDATYGCFAHRFRGACPNATCIRWHTLEQQLIDGLTNRILRSDMMEHTLLSFHRRLELRLAEMEKEARDFAAQSNQLTDELDQLTEQAENIANAIAAGGHRQSPTLLSRLSTIEAQVEKIKNHLAQSEIVERIPVSLDDARNFLMKKASDFKSVLVSDPVLAKDTLRKHIKELVLTPRQTASGPVFDVAGDINLFPADSLVMLMASPTGFEPVLPP
jgi:site-specific DNA recombinase